MTPVEDVYEPLPLYRDVFRDKFRENAEAFFGELVAKSGVDVPANAATVREVRAIAAELEKAEAARAGWGWAIGLSIAALVAHALVARRRLKRMLEGFETDAPGEAVPKMFSYAVYLAKRCLGARFANAPYAKQAQVVVDARACDPQVFVQAAAANDHALFSSEGATELDRALVRRMLDEVQASITANVSTIRKLAYQWLACVRM